MNITDEMLSAFLDAALPEAQMAEIREQLLQSDQLTARLAELAMVDSLVLQHYQQIDLQPMPEAVLDLLDTTKQSAPTPSAQLLAFPWWRRAQQQLQQHAAAVACIALFAGYGLSQLSGSPEDSTLALSQQQVQLLNSAVSGQSYPLSATEQLTPQLSFINQQGDFCRQYQLQSQSQLTQSIACRQQDKWQPVASFSLPLSAGSGQYQTATAVGALDPVLDQLMLGPALTAADEQRFLTKQTD